MPTARHDLLYNSRQQVEDTPLCIRLLNRKELDRDHIRFQSYGPSKFRFWPFGPLFGMVPNDTEMSLRLHSCAILSQICSVRGIFLSFAKKHVVEEIIPKFQKMTKMLKIFCCLFTRPLPDDPLCTSPSIWRKLIFDIFKEIPISIIRQFFLISEMWIGEFEIKVA